MAFLQKPAPGWQQARSANPEPVWRHLLGEICAFPSPKTSHCVGVKVRKVYATRKEMDAAMAEAGVQAGGRGRSDTNARFQSVRLDHPNYQHNRVTVAGTGHTVWFELSDEPNRRQQQQAVVRAAMHSKPGEREYEKKRQIFLRVGGYGRPLKKVTDIGPIHRPAHGDDTRHNKRKAAREHSMLLNAAPRIRRRKR